MHHKKNSDRIDDETERLSFVTYEYKKTRTAFKRDLGTKKRFPYN